MFTQITLVLASGVIFAIRIQRKLAEYKNSMSSQTMKARKQLLLALVLQLAIPVLFLVIPLFILLSIFLHNDGSGAGWCAVNTFPMESFIFQLRVYG